MAGSWPDAANYWLLLLLLYSVAPTSKASEFTHFLESFNANLEAREAQSDQMSFEWHYSMGSSNQQRYTQAKANVLSLQGSVIDRTKGINAGLLPLKEKRELDILSSSYFIPPFQNPADNEEMIGMITQMEKKYAEQLLSSPNGASISPTLNETEVEYLMGTVKDDTKLLWMFVEWRRGVINLKDDYAQTVKLANRAAQEIGFPHLAELWAANYGEGFREMVQNLWDEVLPFYNQLHCYTRQRLQNLEQYQSVEFEVSGGIPSHILGDLWSADWSALYDVLAPVPSDESYDIAPRLPSPETMLGDVESMFANMGFEQLPPSVKDRSKLSEEKGKKINCFPSTFDLAPGVGSEDADLRAIMCLADRRTSRGFYSLFPVVSRLHYSWAYRNQDQVLRKPPIPAMAEAIGIVADISAQPEWLGEVRLIKASHAPPNKEVSQPRQMNFLMRQALRHVAPLPFFLVSDLWRWEVFEGLDMNDWNSRWWSLQEEYMGVFSERRRRQADFDAGARSEMLSFVPMIDRFLGTLMGYHIHKALCKSYQPGVPVYECSQAGIRDAGRALQAVMRDGALNEWREVYKNITGSYEIDASAMIKFYKPLERFIQYEIRNETCGWTAREEISSEAKIPKESNSDPSPPDQKRNQKNPSFVEITSVVVVIALLAGLVGLAAVAFMLFRRRQKNKQSLNRFGNNLHNDSSSFFEIGQEEEDDRDVVQYEMEVRSDGLFEDDD